MKILLVDDEPEILDVIAEFLELKGHAVETAMAAERENEAAVDLISEQKVVMSFASDLNKIRNVISYFNRYTQDLCGVFDLDANKLAICLQECLTNAIIHGNFKVESRLKEEDWSAFDQLIRERQADAELGSKKVFITLHQTPQALTFEVRDEGEGFDPAILPDPTHPESWLKLSGRGILFIRSYMDEVSWNDIGNSITMVKRLA